MELKPGARVGSAVCDATFVVVRAPHGDVDLRCGGAPVELPGTEAAPVRPVDPRHAGGSLVGKRYADDAVGLELLCTRGGDGAASLGDAPLAVKGAKPLPASD